MAEGFEKFNHQNEEASEKPEVEIIPEDFMFEILNDAKMRELIMERVELKKLD